jgi:hypothetical protein
MDFQMCLYLQQTDDWRLEIERCASIGVTKPCFWAGWYLDHDEESYHRWYGDMLAYTLDLGMENIVIKLNTESDNQWRHFLERYEFVETFICGNEYTLSPPEDPIDVEAPLAVERIAQARVEFPDKTLVGPPYAGFLPASLQFREAVLNEGLLDVADFEGWNWYPVGSDIEPYLAYLINNDRIYVNEFQCILPAIGERQWPIVNAARILWWVRVFELSKHGHFPWFILNTVGGSQPNPARLFALWRGDEASPAVDILRGEFRKDGPMPPDEEEEKEVEYDPKKYGHVDLDLALSAIMAMTRSRQLYDRWYEQKHGKEKLDENED